MNLRAPRALQEVAYAEAAREYLRRLPPEHFMEATPQATQREITLASFAYVKVYLTDFYYFNELLVQLARAKEPLLVQVVPDNMAVKSDEPIDVVGSYDVTIQPAKPFWVLEYVSKDSKRKDYEENFEKYEQYLKVPYYLVFYPDAQDLTLFRLGRKGYVSVKPNAAGRLALPEFELEMAILDGWVRYWFRGELVPLPAELVKQMNDIQRELVAERQRAEQERQRADLEQQRAERADQRAEQEKQRAEQEKQRAEQEKQRAEQEKQRAEEAERRAVELERRLAELQGRGKTRKK
jgi:Uma2 family endonuclease